MLYLNSSFEKLKGMARHSGNWKVDEKTPAGLSRLAIQFGFVYGSGGWVGKLLDAIASGEIALIRKEDLEKVRKGD